MTRFFSRKLLLLLVPVALFFGGMAAAWAFDDVSSCEERGEVSCCCCAAGGEAPSTAFGGGPAKRPEPAGPCGMPKGDCGCGSDTRPVHAPDALRLAKPARLLEEPDLLAQVDARAGAASTFRVASTLSLPGERIVSPPEHYLRNSSFLC